MIRPLLLAGAVVASAASIPRIAMADAPPPSDVAVDVALREAPPPHRTLLVEWNPLSMWIRRVSVQAVVAPGDHHALVLDAFYTWVDTVPYGTGIDANGAPLADASGRITGQQGCSTANPCPYTLNVLRQQFYGVGGEIGYRYYFDRGGPRGPFLGPSLILAWIDAIDGNGNGHSFFDWGLAADVGYQAIVGDRWAVGVGAGVQYVRAPGSIPAQQEPAAIVANSALRPRMLLSLGYAFF